MSGTDFGVEVSGIRAVTYGPTGAEYTASGCAIARPNEQIVCASAAGLGRGHRVRVEIGDQRSALGSAIAAALECVRSLAAAPSGAHVRIVRPHTHTRARTPPSPPAARSYAPPTIRSTASPPPSEGGMLTVVGAELARPIALRNADALRARWGATPLTIVGFPDDATLLLEVPPGLPSPAALALWHVARTARGDEHHVVRSNEWPVAYAAPQLERVDVERADTAGSDASRWRVLLVVRERSLADARASTTPGSPSATKLTASSIDVVRWSHREIHAWTSAFDDANVTVHANGGASESVRARRGAARRRVASRRSTTSVRRACDVATARTTSATATHAARGLRDCASRASISACPRTPASTASSTAGRCRRCARRVRRRAVRERRVRGRRAARAPRATTGAANAFRSEAHGTRRRAS